MIQVRDLIIEYPDGTRAIDEVCFAIRRGENVAIVGANGAGKTSLLLALVGVLQPNGGEIQVGEKILNKKNLREIRSQIGMVFQNPDDQLFMPSIYEDIAFGLRSYGCDETETSERANNTLSNLKIENLAKRSPIKLSGGEKRLAAIATVLAMNPDFLLLDEPTAFLDPRAKRSLTAILSQLPQGKLIATHDFNLIERICTRILLLHNGKLVADTGIELLKDEATLEATGL